VGGVVDMLEGYEVVLRNLDNLEKMTDRSLMMFNKEKCKVLHTYPCTPLCMNNSMYQYM